mmetsp:Transcript_109/g.293  ORF Transcript_109/g.293 Transcript_109/m.293 type:complete len:219 (+) Transcript_109:271-927(+)
MFFFVRNSLPNARCSRSLVPSLPSREQRNPRPAVPSSIVYPSMQIMYLYFFRPFPVLLPLRPVHPLSSSSSSSSPSIPTGTLCSLGVDRIGRTPPFLPPPPPPSISSSSSSSCICTPKLFQSSYSSSSSNAAPNSSCVSIGLYSAVPVSEFDDAPRRHRLRSHHRSAMAATAPTAAAAATGVVTNTVKIFISLCLSACCRDTTQELRRRRKNEGTARN